MITDPPEPGSATIDQAKELQREEYEVLESIYPECVSNTLTELGGVLKLEIPIQFDSARPVEIVPDGTLGSSKDKVIMNLSLTTLPSLQMHITLPDTYPIGQPPQLGSIRAKHLWLPQGSRLHDALLQQWKAGEGILYDWIEYIRTGGFLEELGLLTQGDVIQIPHPAPWILGPLLHAFDQSAKSDKFSQTSYPCPICLASQKGSKCVQLTCQHVFCRPCLEDFWKLCIREGEVGRVGCPDPECVKSGREANEEEVALIATEAEIQRWRWLREKRDCEKDPTIVHCPMDFCQTAVRKPPEAIAQEGTGWERLRSCPKCMFSFCVFCRRTWHGPLAPCPIAHSEKIVLEYLGHPGNSEERTAIERRFGRTNVLKLVATYEEEQLNKQWLKVSTMACPGCQVYVEKSLGCNHMTCSKCRQHFCYRCGVKLPASDPYQHFSIRGTSCYYKLFDFQAEGEPMEGFNDH